MSRVYTVPFSATVTAAGGDTDLWELTPADDKPIKLRGLLLSQISEVGDTAEEGLRISIIRLPATVTSGNGSAVTPPPCDSVDTAAGFAAETNGTTVATTSGTAATLVELGWNNRQSPYEWWAPDPAFAPKVKQPEALVVRMQTTLADDMTFAGTIWVEEE
jgi:hypothetical protein